jgi:hypothetical protein
VRPRPRPILFFRGAQATRLGKPTPEGALLRGCNVVSAALRISEHCHVPDLVHTLYEISRENSPVPGAVASPS